jgi:hypothetical protein
MLHIYQFFYERPKNPYGGQIGDIHHIGSVPHEILHTLSDFFAVTSGRLKNRFNASSPLWHLWGQDPLYRFSAVYCDRE